LFGLQHSVMARPSFKAVITKVIPNQLERATYVLATALVIIPLVQFWQPMVDQSVWIVTDPVTRTIITVIYFAGYAITTAATYMLNHNHLFGLQQAFDIGSIDKEFRTPLFYKYVRHPIQTGVLIAMIATPDMTYGRALLAVGMIAYIFIGLYFEEKGLIAEFGDTYREYRSRVSALIPNPFKTL
ncbi:MAG: isoprenylcysteine carboxylmethyltransferase family protein, partial [Kordiimonas sp.]